MKEIKSSTYDTYYQSNAATIYLHKSSRKNAKISDGININHLINKRNDRKVDDDKILMQLVGVIEKIVYNSLKFNKHLEISFYSDIFKQTQYINVDGDLYKGVEDTQIYEIRHELNSLEHCINRVYDLFGLIYPYNHLNRKELFNNSSIKYFINLYYNGRA